MRGFTFVGAEGAHVAIYISKPETPRGLVLFLHGYGLHARMPRYDTLMKSLLDASFAVAAWDCPHHGASSTLGAKKHALRPLRLPTAHVLVHDVREAARVCRSIVPDVPLILMGESMGAALAWASAPEVKPAGVCSVTGQVRVPSLWDFVRATMRADGKLLREMRRDPRIAIGVARPSVWRCGIRLMRLAREALPAIECPVHFAVGTRDMFSVRRTLATMTRCTAVPVFERSVHVVYGGTHDSLATDAEVIQLCTEFATRVTPQLRV